MVPPPDRARQAVVLNRGGIEVGEAGCTLASIDTSTPYLYEFEPEDAGKTACWLLRWVSTRGDVGPFGVLVSAKINS